MITEVLGFSLILPYLPYLAEDLGASPLVIGLILTTFSLFQFVSAPIMGRLSDYYGRKPLLILSQISTFLSFVILGFANTVAIIFLSRIVDGLLGSNFTIAQAYLSDTSTKKNRTKVFGISGVAFGVGFLIGPAIGGFLTRFGYQLPAFLAAGISLITIIITALFLPETVKRKEIIDFKVKIIDWGIFRKYLGNKAQSSNLVQLFSFLLSNTIFVSGFALYARRQLEIGPDKVGFIFAYLGFLSIIFRGVLLSKMIDKWGEAKLEKLTTISMLIGLVGMVFSDNIYTYLPVVTFLSFGMGTLRPLLIGKISKSVSNKEQGAILGVTNSLGSFAQIIAPLISGFILNITFPGFLGLVAALVLLAGAWQYKRKQDNLN